MAATRAGTLRGVLRLREMTLLGVMVCLGLVMAVLQPRFLTLDNFLDIFRDAGILAIVAVGQAVVLVTRNLDLSVGSVGGVAAFLAANFLRQEPDAGLLPALLIAIGAGAAIGLLNGVLVVRGRVPSVVATLGTLYIFRGLLSLPLMAGGGNEVGSSEMSPAYLNLGSAEIAGIPLIAVVAIIVTIVVGLTLRFTTGGRSLYAVGSNSAAARLIGLPTGRVMMAAFVASGVTAGIAGFLVAARFGYVGPDTGTGLELQSIAAAVIGGVAILGGSGSAIGAALGALLLGAIANALAVLNVPGVWLQAITGLFILGAIVLQSVMGQGRGHGRGAQAAQPTSVEQPS